MTRNGRYLVWILAIMSLSGGLLLIRTGGGIPLIALGAVLLLTVFFEPRYRRSDSDLAGSGWQQTSERFRDEESGKWLEVWFNPATGERRYLPVIGELPIQEP